MRKQTLPILLAMICCASICQAQFRTYQEPIYLSSPKSLGASQNIPYQFDRKKGHYELGIGMGLSLPSSSGGVIDPFIVPKFSFESASHHSTVSFYGKLGYIIFPPKRYFNYKGAGYYFDYQLQVFTALFGLKEYVYKTYYLGGSLGFHVSRYKESSNIDYSPSTAPQSTINVYNDFAYALDWGYMIPVGKTGKAIDIGFNFTSINYSIGTIYDNKDITLRTLQVCTSICF